MKELKKLLFLALTGLTFAGCSNSENGPEPVTDPDSDTPEINVETTIDQDVITQIVFEGKPASYSFADVWAFNSDEMSNWEWEEINLHNVDGWSHSFPLQLQFKDGKILRNAFDEPYTPGPDTYETIWNAYCKVTREKRALMISFEFSIDAENNVFSFDGRNYDVRAFNDKSIEFSYVSTYWGGRTNKGGKELTIGKYEKNDNIEADGNSVLIFDSKLDCEKYVLTVAREKFGSSMNLNEIYAPYVILDQPIIDLDALAESIFTD